MATFRLIRLGHPILRQKAKSVPLKKIKSKAFQIFLDKLVATCLKSNGVGIAAPQVGKSVLRTGAQINQYRRTKKS